jgi:hypothetical protein
MSRSGYDRRKLILFKRFRNVIPDRLGKSDPLSLAVSGSGGGTSGHQSLT